MTVITPHAPHRRLIDWEWSGPGDVMSELATMSTLCGLTDDQVETVLELYFGTGDVTSVHRARERLWRMYRLTREAGWCHVKSRCSGWEVTGYDYVAEAVASARRFAEELNRPEVLEWMLEVSAAVQEMKSRGHAIQATP